jgi:Protein of unknown function (DUF3592)
MSIPAIILSILIGAGGLYAYVSASKNYRITREWPQMPATIIEKNIKYIGPDYGNQLVISYHFTVKGKTYESTILHKGLTQYYSDAAAEKTLAQIVENPLVKYNPQDPNDCCLLLYEPGILVWLMLVFGVVLSLVGWVALIRRFTNLVS